MPYFCPMWSWKMTLLAYLLILALPTMGQQMRFRHLTADEGLPENTGQAILQDRQGFIWIGTQNGLVRYDGYEFKVFRHEKDKPHSLSNNLVEALLEDRDGYLWVSTRSGFNRFSPRTETFERFLPDSTSYYGYNQFKYDIHQSADGHIWVNNFYGIYEVVDWDQRDLRFYPLPGDHLTHNTFCFDAADQLWVGQNQTLYQKQGDRLVAHGHFAETIFHLTNLDGQLLIGTKGGIYEWRDTPMCAHRDLPELKGHFISFIRRDREGRTWIGTEVGVFLVEDGQLVQQLRSKAQQPHSLTNDLTLSWCQDRQGLIWIGTGQGINVTDPLHQQILRINSRSDAPFSLPNDNVRSLHFDQHRGLWIATSEGLLHLEFREWPRFTAGRSEASLTQKTLYNRQHPLPYCSPTDHVVAMAPAREGGLWLGTLDGQVLHYQAASRTWSRLPIPEEVDYVRALVEDTLRNQLWIGAVNALRCYDLDRGAFRDLQKLAPINYAIAMGGHADQLWVSHRSGLFRINLATLDYDQYEQSRGLPEHPSNHQMTFLLPTDTLLWMPTMGGGLNAFDWRTETFRAFQQTDGLANDNVWAAYPDDRGRLWLDTDDGVSCFDPQRQSFLNFDRNDGFNFDDFSMLAHAQSPTGEICFANPKGLNIFSPTDLRVDTLGPRVVLTDLELNYRSVVPTAEGVLTQNIANTSQIRLGPEQRIFTLRFSGLDFRHPQGARYAFQLRGYDEGWVERSARERYATYNNLPAGRYTFRVKAANGKGYWGKPVELAIVVLPPFHETWWFRLLLGMLGLGLIAGSLFWYNRRQYEKQLQQIRIQQKIQHERERISRDLHDSVGAHLTRIITDLDLLSLQLERGQTSKGVRRVASTRSFTKSPIHLLRDTIWASNKNQFTVTEFARKLEAFLRYFLGDTMAWRLERELVTERLLSPTEVLNLLRIVQEATQNMLKHSQAQTFVVHLACRGDLVMTIRDDGVGLGPANGGEEQYGLYNMRQRAEQIGATFELHSVVGTEITIRL